VFLISEVTLPSKAVLVVTNLWSQGLLAHKDTLRLYRSPYKQRGVVLEQRPKHRRPPMTLRWAGAGLPSS
jgi:hypothetical protein